MPTEDIKIKRKPMPRWSLLDWSTLLPSYYDCYNEADLILRQQIIDIRRAQDFQSDFQPSSSWFTSSIDDALKNLNEGSYFFPVRYKPRDELSRRRFVVTSDRRANLAGDEIANLAKVIGNKFIDYFDGLKSYQQNEVYHYYFADIQQLLIKASTHSDIKVVKDTLLKVNRYLQSVERLMPADEPFRLFSSAISQDIEQKLLKKVDAIIESTSAVEELKASYYELGQYIEESQAILGKAYRNEKAPMHVRAITSKDKAGHPISHLRHCLQEKSLVAADEASATQRRVDSLPDLEWLDLCDHRGLIPELKKSEQQEYVESAWHLNQLEKYRHDMSKLIKEVERFGEITAASYFDESVRPFFQALEAEITQTKECMSKVIVTNQAYKHDYLRELTENFGLKAFASSISGRRDKVKHFIQNHDELAARAESYKRKEADSHLVMNLRSIESKLLHASKMLISQTDRPQIAPPKTEPEILPVLETEPPVVAYNKAEAARLSKEKINAREAVLSCHRSSLSGGQVYRVCEVPDSRNPARVLIFDKTDSLSPANVGSHLQGDTYGDCQYLDDFLGQGPAVKCEGKETTAYYQSLQPNYARAAFEQVGAQVALAACLFQMGKSAIRWLTSKKEEEAITPISEEEALDFFETTRERLSALKDLFEKNKAEFVEHEAKWLKFCIEDKVDDLKQLVLAHKDKLLSKEDVDCYREDIEALKQSMTFLTPKEIKRRVKVLLKALVDRTGISLNTYKQLDEYYLQLSQGRQIQEVSFINDMLVTAKISSEHLLEATEEYRLLSDFFNSNDKITSDLLYFSDQRIKEFTIREASDFSQYTLINQREDFKTLGRTAHVWRDKSLPLALSAPSSTFFFPPTLCQSSARITEGTQPEPFKVTSSL